MFTLDWAGQVQTYKPDVRPVALKLASGGKKSKLKTSTSSEISHDV